MRARARHAKPSRLRHLTLTTGLATAVAVPLLAAPASAHTVTARASTAASSSSSSSGSYDFGYLKQGSTGARVVELQKRLRVSADGEFGPITKKAVVAFQRKYGLVADGIVGPKTGEALNRYTSGSSSSAPAPKTSSSKGAAVVAEAARHEGKPYVYGAAGPNSFDCSGFVQYVYGRLGVSIPRTSAAQAAAARAVSKSDRQLGDLIIFRTGGSVSHVGIYAGSGTMWVARHTGTTITRQDIYTDRLLRGPLPVAPARSRTGRAPSGALPVGVSGCVPSCRGTGTRPGDGRAAPCGPMDLRDPPLGAPAPAPARAARRPRGLRRRRRDRAGRGARLRRTRCSGGAGRAARRRRRGRRCRRGAPSRGGPGRPRARRGDARAGRARGAAAGRGGARRAGG